ncbi:hypothetical protein AC578_3251 [Pseudocercospora eumusae]|uniref:Uncharacterized protein n=1 Tax=Pseudocercospora eumusae TaxID=321146 RepID=A0A139H272_9PEZI|nr:hypothetical protein AC578_3251 [Pseudocercospora eumusae]
MPGEDTRERRLHMMALSFYGRPSDETTEYMNAFVKQLCDFFLLYTLDNMQFTWDGPELSDNLGLTSGI